LELKKNKYLKAGFKWAKRGKTRLTLRKTNPPSAKGDKETGGVTEVGSKHSGTSITKTGMRKK